MRILAIEDDPGIRATLQDLLELHGHAVATAADGPAGLVRAQEQPELILCDIGLPGMDGFQVLAALQQAEATRDIPFIFLTARAERTDQRQGMALGADDYITKPFTEREILDAIEARVRRQAPLRARVASLLGDREREINAAWSHELLTPLNGVLGALELIEAEAGNLPPEELRELLGLIRAGAERQQHLARKLILHFELEQRKRNPQGRSADDVCSLAEAVQAGVAQAVRSASGPSRADVQVRAADALVPLRSAYLTAAVAELVENACRFSPPGQPVQVTTAAHARGCTVTVTDAGPGMSEQQRHSVAPFAQFDRRKTEQQGLGLGLGIVRSVADLAGGRLVLDAPAAGTGLQARLELPTAAVA